MPRTARASVGGLCYHVLNRGNGRAEVFHKPEDFAALLELLAEANERLPLRILGYRMVRSFRIRKILLMSLNGRSVSRFARLEVVRRRVVLGNSRVTTAILFAVVVGALNLNAVASDGYALFANKWRICGRSTMSADGSLVAHGGAVSRGEGPGVLIIRNVVNSAESSELRIVEEEPVDIAISPDKSLITAITWNRLNNYSEERGKSHLRIWEIKSQKLLADEKFEKGRLPSALRFSSDGKSVWVRNRKRLLQFSISGQKFVKEISLESEFSYDRFGISPDDKWAVVAKHEEEPAWIYDLESGKPSRLLNVAHCKLITECRFSNDGKFVAALARDSRLHIWNLAEVDQPPISLVHDTEYFLFSADSKVIAVVHGAKISIADCRTGQVGKDYELPPHLQRTNFLFPRFLEDGRLSVSGLESEPVVLGSDH